MQSTHILLILSLVFLGMTITEVNSGEAHPFNVHDLVTMKRISEPTPSPNGKKVVFTLRTTDMEANKGRKDLWMMDIDGSDMIQLTQNEASDFSPSWSPDGKCIYFLSTRSGSVQIWKIPVNGGEAMQVTDLPLDINVFMISPDGKKLVVAVNVFPGMSITETKEKLTSIEEGKTTGRLYENIMVRHWDTWKDGRRSHLFVMNVENGVPVDLMPDMDADAPTFPWGGTEEIAFTPDGEGLVFTAKDAGKKEAWSTDYNLYYVQLNDAYAPLKLTKTNKAWDTSPTFSPDGKTLAYLAMSKPGAESDRFRIVLGEWKSGKERILAEDWPFSPSGIFWSKDGKKLFVLAQNFGQRSLFSIDIKSEKIQRLFHDGYMRSPQLAGNKILFGRDDLKSPVDFYTIKLNGKGLKQITHVNKEALSKIQMGDFEQFSFSGANDETVYGYIVKPADFDPEKKYPVAFLIHGGPQGSFGNDFHYRWNPQIYTGAGYAAVMIDFHGSTGYGQDFTDAIHDDWGGKPLEDLQKGLAAALEKCPWMDGEKVGALGASYGGYMINWIAGNWSDRFRCLVNHDGNLDTRMAYYDTEELWFPEWDHAGTPWEKPDHFEKHNPVNYVRNWKTPMLVIHGELDYRVPITQGIATFNALQRQSIPSQFLYFPDENHWVLKPHNSVQWHETVLQWLDRWCK